MKGLNKVMIIGNLGQDPEVKYMTNGNAVCNFSVATSESWKDKATGNMKEKTEWHKIVIYGKTAEIAGEYLRKGSQVYLEGKIQTRKWQDKSGEDRYTTEIVCPIMQMLGSRPQSGSQNGNNRPQNGNNRQRNDNGFTTQNRPPRPQDSQPTDFEDDIPF